MQIALVLSATFIVVALWGVLGKASTLNKPAGLIVTALPILIVSYGYVSDSAINFGWAIACTLAAYVGLVIAALLGSRPTRESRVPSDAAATISRICGIAVTLGIGAIGVMFAAVMIAYFSELNTRWVCVGIVLTGLAVAVGGAGRAIMARIALGTAIAAAVMLVVLGFIVGDPGGVTNPDVVLPGPQTWPAIGYLIAIMLIAIAYPALRRTDVSRARLITAASIAAAISLVSVIGMLMIGGGSVDMPALILIIFPVYTPAAASAVICVFLGIGGTVLVALSLRWTFNELSWLFPSKVEEDLAQDIHEFKPWWAVLSGSALLALAILQPSPAILCTVTALPAAISLLAMLTVRRTADEAPAAPAEEISADTTT